MNPNAAYIRYTWFVLVMVFVVILAGGVVRTTQSGMGCPDWPTCFGRWIPPTNASQLPADYEKYLRTQDIDHTFNAYHTWIEYLNRLLGALLGLFIIIHTFWSFRKFRRSHPSIILLSVLMLLAVIFQGWLGKKVVDANLSVVKVTLHMAVALFIAALPLFIIAKLQYNRIVAAQGLKSLVLIVLALVLIQIVLGTAVREQIDEIARQYNFTNRKVWIKNTDDEFILHRSFSWVVLAGCLFLCWNAYPAAAFRGHCFIVLFFVILSFVAGLVMYFMNIPAWAQPVHLLCASMLAISLLSFRLQMK